jgi:hypothetical protein
MDFLTIRPASLGCIRYNEGTYCEFAYHRGKSVYCTPKEVVMKEKFIAVVEMITEKDREDIKGFGLIKNESQYRKHTIHRDTSLNRYSYNIIHRVGIDENVELVYNNETYILEAGRLKQELMEKLMRGRSNNKRGRGITPFPIKKMRYIEEGLGISWEIMSLPKLIHLYIYAKVKQIFKLEITADVLRQEASLETQEAEPEVPDDEQ